MNYNVILSITSATLLMEIISIYKHTLPGSLERNGLIYLGGFLGGLCWYSTYKLIYPTPIIEQKELLTSPE